MICPSCHGNGYIRTPEPQNCLNCNAQGEIEKGGNAAPLTLQPINSGERDEVQDTKPSPSP